MSDKHRNLTNLYKELRQEINIEEIDYILVTENKWKNNERDVYVPISWFLEQAKRINYYSGYGTAVIDLTLKIVLKDGRWLERREYDGSEWWVLRSKPNMPHEIPKKLDIGILLDGKHKCQQAEIDGQSINRKHEQDKYCMWFEKDGQIITESFDYDEGNYRPEHEELMN